MHSVNFHSLLSFLPHACVIFPFFPTNTLPIFMNFFLFCDLLILNCLLCISEFGTVGWA